MASMTGFCDDLVQSLRDAARQELKHGEPCAPAVLALCEELDRRHGLVIDWFGEFAADQARDVFPYLDEDELKAFEALPRYVRLEAVSMVAASLGNGPVDDELAQERSDTLSEVLDQLYPRHMRALAQ